MEYSVISSDSQLSKQHEYIYRYTAYVIELDHVISSISELLQETWTLLFACLATTDASGFVLLLAIIRVRLSNHSDKAAYLIPIYVSYSRVPNKYSSPLSKGFG